MNKFVSILGLAVLVLSTIVSAEQFVLWNSKPLAVVPLGISDPDGLMDWAVLHDYQLPKYDAGWNALNRKYQLSLLDCDWVQSATEFRPARVYAKAGYYDKNAVCQLKTTKRVKSVVSVIPDEIVVVLENETETNETEEMEE